MQRCLLKKSVLILDLILMCIRGNKQFQEEQYHQTKSHEIRSGNRLMWDHEKTNTILVEIFLSKLLQEIHSQSTLNDLLILSSAVYIHTDLRNIKCPRNVCLPWGHTFRRHLYPFPPHLPLVSHTGRRGTLTSAYSSCLIQISGQ